MLKRIKKLVKKEKGFTLVELLAVIAILAIVVAIAVPTIGNVIGESEDKADKANRELFENAARLAYISDDWDGKESITLASLVSKGYLEEVPQNPETGEKYTGSVDRVTTENEDNVTFEYTDNTVDTTTN